MLIQLNASVVQKKPLWYSILQSCNTQWKPQALRLKKYSAQHLKDDGLHVKTCGILSYGIKFQKSQTTWLWRVGFSCHQSSPRMSLPLQFILRKSLQVVRFSSNLVPDFISSACHTLFQICSSCKKIQTNLINFHHPSMGWNRPVNFTHTYT